MSTKTIQVNKDFFSNTGRSSIKKDRSIRKKHQTSRTISSPNRLRKEFLKKIKDFQKNRDGKMNAPGTPETTPDEDDFELEFNKSLMFLQNVSETRKSDEKKTIHSPSNTNEIEISLSLPKSLRQGELNGEKGALNIILDSMPETSNNPNASATVSAVTKSDVTKSAVTKSDVTEPAFNKSTLTIAPRPPYSSLKNSIHPTYREWSKTQKVAQGVNVPQIVVCDMPIPEESERSAKLSAYKKEIKEDTLKMHKKTRTIKRLLGKTGRSVSVLIKSRQTRRKIQCEQAKLNQTSIHEIKKYLRDRNMIKTGSNSPNDVLRKLYEQCILAGDITNKGDNILIHNFLNV